MVNGMFQIAMSWESLSIIDSQATTNILRRWESAYLERKYLYWDGALVSAWCYCFSDES